MRIRVMLLGALSVLLVACGGGGVPADPCLEANPDLDYSSDVLNCGTCGHKCEVPDHAQAACYAGECGRTACDAGWVDLDGQRGCESQAGQYALPESGVVFWTFPVGAYPTATQTPLQLTSASYAIVGVVGEATVPAQGAASLSSASYVLMPGYTAIQH